jgi:hypothetical protein
VLNLPPDSLTKEIALTQSLLTLLLEHEIPSDLLSFSAASPSTDAAGKLLEPLEAVKGHVTAMQAMIDQARAREAAEREQQKRFDSERVAEEARAYSTSYSAHDREEAEFVEEASFRGEGRPGRANHKQKRSGVSPGMMMKGGGGPEMMRMGSMEQDRSHMAAPAMMAASMDASMGASSFTSAPTSASTSTSMSGNAAEYSTTVERTAAVPRGQSARGHTREKMGASPPMHASDSNTEDSNKNDENEAGGSSGGGTSNSDGTANSDGTSNSDGAANSDGTASSEESTGPSPPEGAHSSDADADGDIDYTAIVKDMDGRIERMDTDGVSGLQV